jgi:hypothetical protein
VYNVSDVRQTEVHTAEPLITGPSRLEVDIPIAKFKRYKSPNSDQILAELIQAGDKMLLSAIHKLINSVWNKEELPHQWKESIIVPIHKKGDKTDFNNYCGISLLTKSYKIVLNILLSSLLVIINVGSDVLDQLLIRFSAFVRYWRKNGSTMRQYIT